MNGQNRNRREFLGTMGRASLAASVLGTALGAESRIGRKPNIVFILIDDLGWSDLGCYGADLHETRSIDSFAAQSMRFTDAYAASPVCTPTRASIQTGKYPARLNMTVWRERTFEPPDATRKLIPPQCVGDLAHENVTVAEILRAGGYQTAHIGKWHLGGAAHYPETHGFDVNIGGTHWGAPNSYFYPYHGSDYYSDYRYIPDLAYGEEGEYLTDRLTTEALHTMEKMKDGPFFLHLAYHSVHTPIEGKPERVEQYREKRNPEYKHQHPGYAAMVHSVDENIGRVLAKIEQLGISDETLVLLFSDNGGYINKKQDIQVTDNYPLRSGKGSLYEGGIREPLLVRWPGVIEPGTVCEEPVSSVDFYPTLLEAAGLEGEATHNRDVDGLSLIPLLTKSQESLERDTLYWHYPHYYFYPKTTPVGAIRRGDWKLLEHFESGQLELFNLEEDLSEQTNLAEKKPEKAKELLNALQNWRSEIRAQMPRANPDYAGS